VRELAEQVELILSICPPHAALDVARAVGDFAGVYVDANAISPMRAQEVAAIRPRFVDGGIVGGPPDEPGTTLYLSGSGAASVAVLFVGSRLEPRVVADASALKMAYRGLVEGIGGDAPRDPRRRRTTRGPGPRGGGELFRPTGRRSARRWIPLGWQGRAGAPAPGPGCRNLWPRLQPGNEPSSSGDLAVRPDHHNFVRRGKTYLLRVDEEM